MKTSDLLVALLSDGITFNRTGAAGIKRFKFITSLKQRLAFLNRLLTINYIINLIKIKFVECVPDAKLADAAILELDSTTARLNAPYNSLFRDHRSAQAVIDICQF